MTFRPPLSGNVPEPNRRPTGIVRDPRYADHCMGPGELECPERLEALYTMVDAPTFAGRLRMIPPRPASTTELGAVHTDRYLRRIAATAGAPPVFLDEDTRTSAHSHETALLASGGLCRAITAVCDGTVANAFALVRPPGHHAERRASGGYCLYNHVAVGARYAQRRLNLPRILIVDWDLHHGNGTQHCFDDDPSVLFFSTHQGFIYPHTGRLRDTGKGRGKGYTINVPLPAGMGDGDFLHLFETLLRPVALAFAPDLILVSAGFDIHKDDPLGSMRVTPQGFAALTRLLMEIAGECCDGRLVLTLEGGYDLPGLAQSVHAVLRELTGMQHTDPAPIRMTADRARCADVIWRVRQTHRRRWPCLAPGTGDDRPPSRSDRWRAAWARCKTYFNS